MLVRPSNKVYCGTKTLSYPWSPWKLAWSRSLCTRKSWRVSVLTAELPLQSYFSPIVVVPSTRVQLCTKTLSLHKASEDYYKNAELRNSTPQRNYNDLKNRKKLSSSRRYNEQFGCFYANSLYRSFRCYEPSI